MGHSGGPDEEEVIVIEEPESVGPGPRVVRVPRTPTQKEIDAHNVTHLPHEEWCEFCMSGRARNKPHRSKGRTRSDRDGGEVGDLDASDAPSGSDAEELPKPGPVPRICMDYFYVSSGGGSKRGAHGMTTKELQKRLRELGRFAEGQRNVLIKRYEKYVTREGQEEMGE